jgi:hypothetical protein
LDEHFVFRRAVAGYFRARARLARPRERRGDGAGRSESFVELCEELLSGRGEASGVALACEILARYGELTTGPLSTVIPGRAKGAGPESITPACVYEFRARRCAAHRNDR